MARPKLPIPLSEMHRCLDDEQVVQLAAGLIAEPEARQLIVDVETCETCRELLVEAGVALRASKRSSASENAVFQVGEWVAGRYRIDRFVGRGGMGEVFEVFDAELQERVALKTIRAEYSADPTVVKRFKQELRIARKVVHPNVCRVFDLGSFSAPEGHRVYFHTMEYMEGQPLSRWRQERGVPLFMAAGLVRQLALGLSVIHEQGIVHRDFKTDNIMVCQRPEPIPKAVVLDFGLARSAQRFNGLETTGPDVRMGTPDYMAPEVLRGAPATAASDVFSFGLVAYELLVGHHPCPYAGSRATLSVLGELKYDPPVRVRAEIPVALSQLILRCLDNDPARRPTSGTEVVRQLERLEEQGQLWT